MIVKNNRNNQTELAFGKGDICIAGGYIQGDMLKKIGLVTFINQDPREIGVEGITESDKLHPVGEFPVIMTFTDSKSIDVVIEQLLSAQKSMRTDEQIKLKGHQDEIDSIKLKSFTKRHFWSQKMNQIKKL